MTSVEMPEPEQRAEVEMAGWIWQVGQANRSGPPTTCCSDLEVERRQASHEIAITCH